MGLRLCPAVLQDVDAAASCHSLRACCDQLPRCLIARVGLSAACGCTPDKGTVPQRLCRNRVITLTMSICSPPRSCVARLHRFWPTLSSAARTERPCYPAASIVTSWSASENVLWSTPTTNWSNASPVIVGDRIIICAEPDEALSLSAADGKVLWRARTGYANLPAPTTQPAPENAQGQRLHLTDPGLYGNVILTLNGHGVVACMDMEGKQRWMKLIEYQASMGHQCFASPRRRHRGDSPGRTLYGTGYRDGECDGKLPPLPVGEHQRLPRLAEST